ncbi:MAG: DUF433 domain-containing protein [Actinobacteria bacterium]|nr:DUF433 domain-containing protein [Actinomycetota bacterium]
MNLDEIRFIANVNIERNQEIMYGKLVIKGTHLPIDLLLEKLAYGYKEEMLIEEYPFLTNEDIRAVLLYAAKIV